MSRRRTPLLPAALLLLGVPLSPALAQTPPTPAKPAAGPASLADALAALPPVPGRLVLTVGAPAVRRPPGAAPAAGLEALAPAYGRVLRQFGAVTALAPASMTVLNASPQGPNIYDGMPPQDAFKLLAASLSDAEWGALTSEEGLRVSALETDDQRRLFAAVFPGGALRVHPPFVPGQPWRSEDTRDVSGELSQARLRLGRRTDIELPMSDHSWRGVDLPGAGTRAYQVVMVGPGPSRNTLYGVPVSADAPNAPKKGDMDYSNPALQVPVSLDGLKTVGDLVARSGEVTHVELYADPHYAGKPLTLVAGAGAAPAGDLLRALAFCVTGTFRRVGPAFVLTDDLIGVGTRRQIWREFEDDADALRKGPLGAAGDKIVTAHPPRALPVFADPDLGISPAQDAARRDMSSDPGTDYLQLPVDSSPRPSAPAPRPRPPRRRKKTSSRAPTRSTAPRSTAS